MLRDMRLEGLGILIVPVVIAVVIAAIVYSSKAAKKRREELAALAAELGWRFDPGRDTHHDDEYAHFEVFRKGHSRAAFNTLAGSLEIAGAEYPVKMGDFTYKVTQHTGKSTSTHTYRFSYLILHLPYVGVPDLLIRREGVFDKIAAAIGFDDIDFESAEFSRKFLVKSPDKRFAYDIIHPRMMEFLLQEQPPGIDIERNRCCLMDGTRRWSADEFRRAVEWARAFFALWPEHVTTQLRERAGESA